VLKTDEIEDDRLRLIFTGRILRRSHMPVII
jgi:hypothetical protein